MLRYLVLVVLAAMDAWPQAPAYNAASIVNASNYTSGPFAPNSVLSVFGSNLSWSTAWPAFNPIASYTFPTQLGGVEVFIDNSPVALLYVSGSQINFIVPDNQIAGDVTFRSEERRVGDQCR